MLHRGGRCGRPDRSGRQVWAWITLAAPSPAPETRMSRIVRFHEPGGPEVLRIEELAEREPDADEVRLQVAALGLNRSELSFRYGRYLEAPTLPSRIGYDAAGVIDAVGSDVTGLRPGMRVSTIPAFSMSRHGVYGETAVVPARAVAPYPERLTPLEGAAIWMPYLTAWGALVRIGGLARGTSVIVTAASSSVGLAAIQMVKDAGGVAIATTRGADKRDFLHAQGADHVIVTDAESLPERALEVTGGRGADIVFDPVAGPFLELAAMAVCAGGLIISYGALHPQPTPFPLRPALKKGLTIRGYVLFEFTQDPALLAPGLDYVTARLASGVFRPVLDRVFAFEDIVAAHRYMESNEQRGKVVVSVP